MKSAVFLSNDPGFASLVTDLLRARGGEAFGDTVQLIEPGEDRGMFSWQGRYPAGAESDFRDSPWAPAEGVTAPDMRTVDGYYVECRWERQVAEIAKAISDVARGPVWVHDNDGVIWDANAVDPDRVRL